MFNDADNSKDNFARLMLVILDESRTSEKIEKLKGGSIPLELVSGLVNIQRDYIDIPRNNHRDYDEVLEDAVVADDCESRDLDLVLSALVSEMKFCKILPNGKSAIDINKVISIVIKCEKYLVSKKKIRYRIKEYTEFMEGYTRGTLKKS